MLKELCKRLTFFLFLLPLFSFLPGLAPLNFTNEPFDVVIPCHKVDADVTLSACFESIVVQYQNS